MSAGGTVLSLERLDQNPGRLLSAEDKLGIVDFPMPQFILIGRQSVGKSRLIEARKILRQGVLKSGGDGLSRILAQQSSL